MQFNITESVKNAVPACLEPTFPPPVIPHTFHLDFLHKQGRKINQDCNLKKLELRKKGKPSKTFRT